MIGLNEAFPPTRAVPPIAPGKVFSGARAAAIVRRSKRMDAGRFSSLAKVGSRMVSGRRLTPIRMGMQVISHLFRLDKKRRARIARAAKSNKGQAELPGGVPLAGLRGRRLYSAGFPESP
jgi:hypothetical protein